MKNYAKQLKKEEVRNVYDTIIIDNGTGFLLEVEGVLITRNGKNVENDYISVPEKFGYDGDSISVYKKVNGHDNVYRWHAGL